MLEKDPSKRLTIDGVLKHSWFNESKMLYLKNLKLETRR